MAELNKQFIKQKLAEAINWQLIDLQAELLAVTDEMAKETKSSAGDKFETSREMMNQERGRIEGRIAHLKLQLNTLTNLADKPSPTIQNGSLVETNQGIFFFGLAFGKLVVNKKEIMVLSLNSPLGKVFFEKIETDPIIFMNREYRILKIS